VPESETEMIWPAHVESEDSADAMTGHRVIESRLPFLLPWVRVALLIREIRATTWDGLD